jgi:hypothetical protein
MGYAAENRPQEARRALRDAIFVPTFENKIAI